MGRTSGEFEARGGEHGREEDLKREVRVVPRGKERGIEGRSIGRRAVAAAIGSMEGVREAEKLKTQSRRGEPVSKSPDRAAYLGYCVGVRANHPTVVVTTHEK